jgi:Concanavalin A-like lectin/glucanases superfamily
MSAAITLFRLVGDSSGMFDGSVIGVPILTSTGAKVLPEDRGIALDKGAIDIGRQSDLDSLQSFTIEAEIVPSSLGDARQNIIEGQTPAIALFVEANGKLTGSVHTGAGWVTVDSGAVVLRAGTTHSVTFTRDANGKNELFIDGDSVGSKSVAGPITSVGALGFRVGRGMDGTSFPFSGTVKDLSIRHGVVTQQFFAKQAQAAQLLEAKVKQAGVIKNIVINLLPDASHARLQHVKDIMNAAGVQTVSDLDTLPVTTPTPLSRGQVLIAVLATCGIRRPAWACENTSCCLLLIADSPSEEYHLKQQISHLYTEGTSTVQRIFTLVTWVTRLCLRSLHHCFVAWTKPDTTSLLLLTLTDQARSKSDLVAENARLRKPLITLRRQVKQPACPKTDRMLLVLLSSMVRTWKQALVIVQKDDAPAMAPPGLQALVEIQVEGSFSQAKTIPEDYLLD